MIMPLNDPRQERFEQAAKLIGYNYQVFLEGAKEWATSQGLQVTFEGDYSQASQESPNRPIIIPFALAQTSDEIRLMMREGKLTGKTFELESIAQIAGNIDNQIVRFNKSYVFQGAEELKLVGYDHPDIINYEGKSKDGKEYIGIWRFSAEPIEADLMLSGNFSLRKSD